MNGERRGGRLVSRGVLAATLVGGSMLAVAGTAHAHNRSTDVVCVDETTGEWRASMRFSSIEVREGHPVIVTFGSASATLATPGPDGAATLTQNFGGDQASATLSWSISRNGVVEQSGSESFDQPAGCQPPPPTEPPPTEPPATTAPQTPGSVPAGSTPDAPTTAPPASRPSAPAPLPATGPPTMLGVVLGAAAVAAGALVVRWTRRHADELIGD